MKYQIITLVLLVICIIALPIQSPIIGVYTQTTEVPSLGLSFGPNTSYIAASYVKYIQMSGAQVIPLLAYSSQSYFQAILPKLNGVLFPGGDAPIDIGNIWTKNAVYILKYAKQQNDKGNVYPVWGTCLGMQLLAYITSEYNNQTISPVSGEVGVKNRISIQPESILFKGIGKDLRYHLQDGVGILFFSHNFAVRKEFFLRNQLLSRFWQVEAYTTTRAKQTFLSVFRAKNYPFFGVQFHPEKHLYQWRVFADRSSYGVEIAQILSNRFIEYARKNGNSLNYEQFRKASIYNYPTYQTPEYSTLAQAYIFPEMTSFQPTERLKSKTLQIS